MQITLARRGIWPYKYVTEGAGPDHQGRTKIDNVQLKEARQKLGLTQKQLAYLIETDPRSVRKMESDPKNSTARNMPVRVWRLICAYLDGWRPADWPETTRKD